MSAPSTELALLWLRKADNDLITARQTLLLADGPTDTVAFHAQQPVEKALKVSTGSNFPESMIWFGCSTSHPPTCQVSKRTAQLSPKCQTTLFKCGTRTSSWDPTAMRLFARWLLLARS